MRVLSQVSLLLLALAAVSGCASSPAKPVPNEAITAAEIPDSALKPQVEIRALKQLRLAQAAMLAGDDAQAAGLFKDALELYERLDDKSAQAAIHSDLGLLLARHQKYDKALQLIETALILSQDQAERVVYYEALYNHGHVLSLAGKDDAATRDFDLIVGSSDKTLPEDVRGYALNARGTIRRRTGDIPGSLKDFEELGRLWHQQGEPLLVAVASLNRGYSYILAGQIEEGLQAWTLARDGLASQKSTQAQALKEHLDRLLRTGRKDTKEVVKLVRESLKLPE